MLGAQQPGSRKADIASLIQPRQTQAPAAGGRSAGPALQQTLDLDVEVGAGPRRRQQKVTAERSRRAATADVWHETRYETKNFLPWHG